MFSLPFRYFFTNKGIQMNILLKKLLALRVHIYFSIYNAVCFILMDRPSSPLTFLCCVCGFLDTRQQASPKVRLLKKQKRQHGAHSSPATGLHSKTPRKSPGAPQLLGNGTERTWHHCAWLESLMELLKNVWTEINVCCCVNVCVLACILITAPQLHLKPVISS